MPSRSETRAETRALVNIRSDVFGTNQIPTDGSVWPVKNPLTSSYGPLAHKTRYYDCMRVAPNDWSSRQAGSPSELQHKSQNIPAAKKTIFECPETSRLTYRTGVSENSPDFMRSPLESPRTRDVLVCERPIPGSPRTVRPLTATSRCPPASPRAPTSAGHRPLARERAPNSDRPMSGGFSSTVDTHDGISAGAFKIKLKNLCSHPDSPEFMTACAANQVAKKFLQETSKRRPASARRSREGGSSSARSLLSKQADHSSQKSLRDRGICSNHALSHFSSAREAFAPPQRSKSDKLLPACKPGGVGAPQAQVVHGISIINWGA